MDDERSAGISRLDRGERYEGVRTKIVEQIFGKTTYNVWKRSTHKRRMYYQYKHYNGNEEKKGRLDDQNLLEFQKPYRKKIGTKRLVRLKGIVFADRRT